MSCRTSWPIGTGTSICRWAPWHTVLTFGQPLVEKANVGLTLASKIPPAECARLNLGYRDPATINPAEWQNREDEGYLYVPKAGEMLYKVR